MNGERKVINYKVIGKTDPEDLEIIVKRFILRGWNLQGGLCFTHTGYFSQAMVKYEDKEDMR